MAQDIVVTHTWNPIIGCLHECAYCMARDMAERFSLGASYADEHSKLSNAKSNSVILVCDKSDMFGHWSSDDWIISVIEEISEADPSITFLFLTRNPTRFHTFVDMLPENCLLGATIETNKDEIGEEYSKAPKPSERYLAMKDLSFSRKFIHSEPLFDFDSDVITSWIREIAPEEYVLGRAPRMSDLLNPEKKSKPIGEMYCWNCETTREAERVQIVPEVGDNVPEPPLVTCCLECRAILEQIRITCYLCKDYNRAFYTGLMMHGGLLYHALCEDCRKVVEDVAGRQFNF
ncbi:MAG TPA: DUF5131 family protein [Candidatus Bathyarchaeia archaeon]|nr:DUF5131 family protein [Candidatus Bathyarchaeia archaeon]